MSKQLSQRAYAAHRGVHHSAVSKAIREGRLKTSLTPKNQIKSAVAADEEWAANTRPRKQQLTQYELARANSLESFSAMTKSELIAELIDTASYATALVFVCVERVGHGVIAEGLKPLIGKDLPSNALELLEQDVFAAEDRKGDELG